MQLDPEEIRYLHLNQKYNKINIETNLNHRIVDQNTKDK